MGTLPVQSAGAMAPTLSASTAGSDAPTGEGSFALTLGRALQSIASSAPDGPAIAPPTTPASPRTKEAAGDNSGSSLMAGVLLNSFVTSILQPAPLKDVNVNVPAPPPTFRARNQPRVQRSTLPRASPSRQAKRLPRRVRSPSQEHWGEFRYPALLLGQAKALGGRESPRVGHLYPLRPPRAGKAQRLFNLPRTGKTQGLLTRAHGRRQPVKINRRVPASPSPQARRLVPLELRWHPFPACQWNNRLERRKAPGTRHLARIRCRRPYQSPARAAKPCPVSQIHGHHQHTSPLGRSKRPHKCRQARVYGPLPNPNQCRSMDRVLRPHPVVQIHGHYHYNSTPPRCRQPHN